MRLWLCCLLIAAGFGCGDVSNVSLGSHSLGHSGSGGASMAMPPAERDAAPAGEDPDQAEDGDDDEGDLEVEKPEADQDDTEDDNAVADAAVPDASKSEAEDDGLDDGASGDGEQENEDSP